MSGAAMNENKTPSSDSTKRSRKLLSIAGSIIGLLFVSNYVIGFFDSDEWGTRAAQVEIDKRAPKNVSFSIGERKNSNGPFGRTATVNFVSDDNAITVRITLHRSLYCLPWKVEDYDEK